MWRNYLRIRLLVLRVELERYCLLVCCYIDLVHCFCFRTGACRGRTSGIPQGQSVKSHLLFCMVIMRRLCCELFRVVSGDVTGLPRRRDPIVQVSNAWAESAFVYVDSAENVGLRQRVTHYYRCSTSAVASSHVVYRRDDIKREKAHLSPLGHGPKPGSRLRPDGS